MDQERKELTSADVYAEINQRGAVHAPKLPEIIWTLPVVKIFNVFDKQWLVNRGGLGDFLIQPCGKGMPCSPPTEIRAVVPDHVNISQCDCHGRVMGLQLQDGRELAQDIIGATSLSGHYGSPYQWGCFVATGQEPTGFEIDEARFRVWKTCVQLVSDADKYFSSGEEMPQNPMLNISQVHQVALAYVQTHRPKWAI